MVCNVGIHFSDPLRSTANVCGQWYIIHMTPTSLPQALPLFILLPPSLLSLSSFPLPPISTPLLLPSSFVPLFPLVLPLWYPL